MTTTDKPVTRRTRFTYQVLYASASKAREIVVTIAPGDIFEFREKGCKSRWTLPIESAFRQAVKIKAFAELMERGRERKARGLKPRRKGARS